MQIVGHLFVQMLAAAGDINSFWLLLVATFPQFFPAPSFQLLLPVSCVGIGDKYKALVKGQKRSWVAFWDKNGCGFGL